MESKSFFQGGVCLSLQVVETRGRFPICFLLSLHVIIKLIYTLLTDRLEPLTPVPGLKLYYEKYEET